MEKIPIVPDNTNSTPEVEKKELSPKKKFEILLSLFGTEKAKENFLENCEKYLIARSIHEAQVNMSDAENYRPNRKIVYSPPQRANAHNKVMETIQAIATEIKNINPEQESVLRDFSNRETVAQAIREYLQSKQDKEYYDEEEPTVNKRDMSGPAYFHSLGRGN